MKNFATLILLFLTFENNHLIAEGFFQSLALASGAAGEIEDLNPQQLKNTQEQIKDKYKISDGDSKIFAALKEKGMKDYYIDYLIDFYKRKQISLKDLDVSKKDIDFYTKKNREHICEFIKEQLLLLEKYSTTKDKNKLTYIMIPIDHPIYPFPYNLEDRIKFLKDNVKNLLDYDIEFKLEKEKISYELSFKNNKYIKDNDKKLQKLGFKLNNNIWAIKIS